MPEPVEQTEVKLAENCTDTAAMSGCLVRMLSKLGRDVEYNIHIVGTPLRTEHVMMICTSRLNEREEEEDDDKEKKKNKKKKRKKKKKKKKKKKRRRGRRRRREEEEEEKKRKKKEEEEERRRKKKRKKKKNRKKKRKKKRRKKKRRKKKEEEEEEWRKKSCLTCRRGQRSRRMQSKQATELHSPLKQQHTADKKMFILQGKQE